MNKIEIVLIMVVCFIGCKRDRLVFPVSQNALLELRIDWSRSALEANSATAVIYKDGEYFSTEIVTAYPPTRKLIDLPVGRYDVIVHNDLLSDFEKSLEFNKCDDFRAFEVAAIEDISYSRAPTRNYKSDVDTLATDRFVGFEVTQKMVDDSKTTGYAPVVKSPDYNDRKIVGTIDFTPRREFTEVKIVVKAVNGNGYYFTKGNPVELRGLAASFFPANKMYSSTPVVHALTLAPVLRKGSNETVIFEGDMLVVGITGRNGTLPEFKVGDYSILLPFVFNGGIVIKELDLVRDATKFEFTEEDPFNKNQNSDKLYIEIDIELDKLISIGNVDVGVEDWGDVDIPLDGPRYLYFVANNNSSQAFSRTNTNGLIINMPSEMQFTPDDGFKFKEWNSRADGTGVAYAAGAQYEMVPGGAIFYAIWEKTRKI